ncbi:hypothetical protein V8C86DRAFT_2560491 [Haematococcus lacustris]
MQISILRLLIPCACVRSSAAEQSLQQRLQQTELLLAVTRHNVQCLCSGHNPPTASATAPKQQPGHLLGPALPLHHKHQLHTSYAVFVVVVIKSGHTITYHATEHVARYLAYMAGCHAMRWVLLAVPALCALPCPQACCHRHWR